MAASLALLAALLFALAATLQQRGALSLPEVSLLHPSSVVRLGARPIWLVGTFALLVGYAAQAAALDRGRLVVIQPLLVTTILFALPLGWLLTQQRVGLREGLAALAVIAGLALFVEFGDPAGGRQDAPGPEWIVAVALVAVLAGLLAWLGTKWGPGGRAAAYGAAAGLLFGLSATLTKPTIEKLHGGLIEVLSDWRVYVLLGAGFVGFVLQQVSLGTGRLAPSVATVSVVNPVLAVVLGALILDERLSRPTWHVVVAVLALGMALAATVVISFGREPGPPEQAASNRRGSEKMLRG